MNKTKDLAVEYIESFLLSKKDIEIGYKLFKEFVEQFFKTLDEKPSRLYFLEKDLTIAGETVDIIFIFIRDKKLWKTNNKVIKVDSTNFSDIEIERELIELDFNLKNIYYKNFAFI